MFKLLEEDKTYLHLLIEREKSRAFFMRKKKTKKKEIDHAFENFKDMINKKGFNEISIALKNLQKWNKKKNPELSIWAKEMRGRLKKWVAAGKEDEVKSKKS